MKRWQSSATCAARFKTREEFPYLLDARLLCGREHPTDDKGDSICSHESIPGGNRVESFETYRSYLFAIAYRQSRNCLTGADEARDFSQRFTKNQEDPEAGPR